ncbi:endosomal transmembrane epsin interactor 1 [Latimeria chalumnae]|uniref:Endosomal transmembrane epsin interactor 1 n=1 Tax=Latimeria chalumnae TaxID=7897 RepID=H3APV1_LATCH|nr:PREDICTED: protein FAM189A2 [Latimeria chalumnae]|eukprot:XP_006004278.1 PREDICTED: protein FAM189A2 [Latimeria chalumnae]
MSLPVVLPGSCCPVAGLSALPQSSDPALRSRSRCPPLPAARSPMCPPRAAPALLPGRPLLSLGLLQLVLGCSMVALSFGALSLSGSPQIRNSCPFWAGSSVILSGIIGLTTWRRPMLLLVNLFVLLSVVCVLLNLAGFVLCCQGAQLVSSVPSCQMVELAEGDACLCCDEFQASKCAENENVLKLYPVQSCSAVRLLLKKVLFALCALNALTTTVCLVAAALRYLQMFAARRPCLDETRATAEDGGGPAPVPDPEEFVPPIPPPSYFSTFYSYTPRMNRRMLGTDVIPLPHIYGARIKSVEVFCPMEPPPPYEAVVGQSNTEQDYTVQVADLAETDVDRLESSAASQDRESPSSNLGSCTSHPNSRVTSTSGCRKPCKHVLQRSHSDPLLQDLASRGLVLSCEAATQTETRPDVAQVTLRRCIRARVARARPRSLVDYQSYQDTKLLVARFLEQSSCSMTPDVQELVENIKSVLKSGEEHMDEAVLSANFLEQVMNNARQATAGRVHTLPLRRRPGLLHLESCGDLSTFTTVECQLEERRGQRAEQDRPHSLIGVVRETVL